MAPSTAILKVVDFYETHSRVYPNMRAFILTLSDGETSYPAILHTHFNKYIINNKIVKGSIIKVTKYSAKPLIDKVAFIILGLEILRNENIQTVEDPLNVISPSEFNFNELTQPPLQHNLISDLNPYMFSWAIKVRIINKSIRYEKRTPDGSKFSFSCVLKDKEGSEATIKFGHKETLKFYDMLKYGNVYSIANGIVESTQNESEYSIVAADKTRIYREPDDHSIGYESYQFQTLADISTKKPRTADFIGVAVRVGPLEEIDFGERRGIPKRVVMMGDQSNYTVEVTIYDNLAQKFPSKGHNIVAFKNLNMSYKRGISFHTGPTTLMSLNIECNNRSILLNWWNEYESIACDLPRLAISGNFLGHPIKISEIEERGLGREENRDDYFIIDCIITEIDSRHKCIYPACPNALCRWKGLYQKDGVYICERCLNHVKDPVYRYAFPLKLSDDTGSITATLLGNDVLGKDILGCTATEWASLTSNETPVEISERINRQAYRHFRMKIRAKFDTFSAITKTRFSIVAGQKISFSSGARQIAAMIEEL